MKKPVHCQSALNILISADCQVPADGVLRSSGKGLIVHSGQKHRADARQAVRYVVGAPVKFMWSEGANRFSGVGVTKDVSPKSLFIWAENTPPVGAAIECQVFLSGAFINAPAINMLVDGQVIRLEQHAKEHQLLGLVVLNQKVTVNTTHPSA